MSLFACGSKGILLRTPIVRQPASLLQPLHRTLSTAARPQVKQAFLQPSRRFQSGYSGYSNVLAAQTPALPPQAYSQKWWRQIAYSVGTIGLGAVALNFALNRETREALNPFEREYLNSSFKYLAGGLTVVTGELSLLNILRNL